MKYLFLLSCLIIFPLSSKELSLNKDCLKYKDFKITLWGGQMVDADIVDAFFLKGKIPSSRKEYLSGVGIQKEIIKKTKILLTLRSITLGIQVKIKLKEV